MAEPFLELISITKTYPGVTALDDVSLSVAKGEIVGLIGENGAGKSTLMKILGGVTIPSAGHLRVDGVERPSLDVSNAASASRHAVLAPHGCAPTWSRCCGVSRWISGLTPKWPTCRSRSGSCSRSSRRCR